MDDQERDDQERGDQKRGDQERGDQERGDDAADHAPRPGGDPKPPEQGKQDAPNYDEREDGGRALDVGDVSSANDE